MVTQTGNACGTCSECGKTHCRPRPRRYVYCDCWRYCPRGHEMKPYVPDTSSGVAYDPERGMTIVMYCDVCSPIYYSKLLPVEVELS